MPDATPADFPVGRARENAAGIRRWRIGVELHAWNGPFEGLRSHVVGLFSAAVRLPSEFDFVFFLKDPKSLADAHPVFRSPHVELVRAPGLHGLLRVWLELPFLRKAHRIDLLHTQYRIPFWKTGPTACTIHDVLFESHPEHFSAYFIAQAKLSFRHAARRSDLLFSVSEFSRRELSRRYGIAEEQIQVVPNGIDARRFYPGEDGAAVLAAYGLSRRSYLLTVGRIEPRKNHAMLIGAYAKLGQNAPPLVIVGQRDRNYESDPLHRWVDASKLGNKVRFLPAVDDDALPVLMRNALFFIYPSFAEGFGMPVLEAMASGIPVITSNTAALPEVTGAAALCIDPYSSAELLSAMQLLLGSDAKRTALAEAGLVRAKQFAWQRAAESLLAGYRSFFARSMRCSTP